MRTQAEQRLQHSCERALAAAGRASGAGTRQQVRAAARRFVRRHRANRSFLAFALRSALANSAFAVALLGLAAAPAGAATAFSPLTGTANPLAGQDVGSYSRPALGDLDADGDLDLLAGNANGLFRYFENTGGATSPSYAQRTGSANPLAGQDVGYDAAPALGDLDGDGDLDLLVGTSYDWFVYYENTGTATAPAYVERSGSADPFDSFAPDFDATPAFGDVDGDGDLDVVASGYDGLLRYYQNTGSATAPAFVQRTGSANPLGAVDLGYYAAPALADLDRDGDLDLVAGEAYGAFRTYDNTGAPLLPAFALRTGSTNPLYDVDVGSYSAPALGDLDGDGDLDLVPGESDGAFLTHENFAGDFLLQTGAANPLDGEDLGYSTKPAAGDLDGDGDLDLVGTTSGTFYYENIGSATLPAFVRRTGSANPLNGLFPVGGSDPGPTFALGDLDGDGDLDVFAGMPSGALHYAENTGNATSPAFVERTGPANPMNGLGVGARATPTLGDLDGDGDLDLVTGDANHNLSYFENNGSTIDASFVQRTGSAFPLPGPNLGLNTHPRPALGDVDRDGDVDLVVGKNTPGTLYYENTGSAALPVFVQRTGDANPFTGFDLGGTVALTLGDFDADADLDVVAGNYFGNFAYLENGGVRPSPRYFGPNVGPFAGLDVGIFSAPVAGDLDADGDADFVAAHSFADGSFHYFENTGSAQAAALVSRTGAANPFSGLSGGVTPRLALGDLDADGDLDLLSCGNAYGFTNFFENTGDAAAPAFVERVEGANPFAPIVVARCSPAFGDLDRDGDIDLVMGEVYGAFLFFENTGDASAPLLVQRTGSANPLDGLAAPNFTNPALGDVDRDGDLDLVAGDEPQGQLHYFENTGTAEAPAFVARSGAANPLNGADVGLSSSPALVDIERDGDLDVVSGDQGGTFRVYTLPEPSGTSLFAAGASLLAWLARRRRSGA